MTIEPLQPCDLVMQGAVASGVVYPPAILKLKDNYRFRNIGGTSAGAIAAAGAATAEYNRERDGFKQLKEMSDWLGQDRNLRDLFQPSADTKPLMNLVDVFFPPYPAPPQDEGNQQMTSKPTPLQSMLKAVGRLLYSWLTNYPGFSISAVLGAIMGLILFAFLPLAMLGLIALFTSDLLIAKVILGILGLIFIIIGGWLGYQIGGVVDAIIKLPNNFYGICTGLNDNPNVLTNWLSNYFNEMAGMNDGKPLTFGDLKKKKLQNGQDVSITLRMITSNLSQSQPFLLPTGLKGFLFKEDEMIKLFPNYIVKHLVDFAGTSPIISNDKLPQLPEGQKYYFLPDEDDLPVVVAMRMSLSFPILLSAVPLYTIRASAIKGPGEGPQPQLQEKTDLQKNWFSDGGICNNFPIEFFDFWLPPWPTFGISLTSIPPEAFENKNPKPSTEGPGNAYTKQLNKEFFSAPTPNDKRSIPSEIPDVYLPRADALPISQWQKLEGVVAFLSAILGTGLGWHQILQTRLPSYRDRVVQIRLSEAEGGLHLNMPPEVIKTIVDKGGQAGDLLNPGNDLKKFNFEYHKWVRFRVLMAKLEENFKNIEEIVLSSALENLLDEQASAYNKNPYPFGKDSNWCTQAKVRIKELRNPLEDWKRAGYPFFQDDLLKPDTVLQVTPEI
jgi:predicted acylesterase/phospholipase RssA